MIKAILIIFFTPIYCISQGVNSTILIEDFKQGRVRFDTDFKTCAQDSVAGNCASVALIKAAIAEFGSVRHIFKSFYEDAENKVTATMADDYVVTVDSSEVKIADRLGNFGKSDNSIYHDSANIVYAIMAKRLEKDSNLVNKLISRKKKRACIQSYTNAVETLNSGFNTSVIYKLLGLKKERTYTKAKKIKSLPAAIILCNKHAAFSSFEMHDSFGEATSNKNGRKMKNAKGDYKRITKAYTLKKP